MVDLHAVPHSPSAFLAAFAMFGSLNTVRYVVPVAISFVCWWWWQRKPQHRHRIQPAPLPRGQVWREVAYSTVSLLIFGLLVPVLIVLGVSPDFAFYPDIATRGWPYFFASIALMLFIQDTWFYWTHRLMHHPLLFRRFHLAHHRSTNPDPLTTYTISPMEAVIDSVPTVAILILLPKTFNAYLFFLWLNAAYAVYGHLGYEILPRGSSRHWLGRWINTSVAHNTHHARGRYNYGWYFLFWDRLMGTLDPEYDRRYNEITAAPQPSDPDLRRAA